MFFIPKTIYFS